MASANQEIVNQLCKVVEKVTETADLLKASEDRTIDVYFVTVPETGGTRTFATGTTKINFANGQIINPDGTVEELSRKLDLVQDKEVMHSVSIHCSNAPITFSLDSSGLQTVQQEFLFQLPYVTFKTIQITCTESTEISIFACTNPQATLGNFRLTQITDISQPYIVADDPELTTWPATLISLSDNMSRIRNQIISITGESWGTVSNSISSILSTITGHDHDGTDSKKVSAENVLNTPAGNIVAIEVQAAIDELDGQDTAHASDTSTHGVAEVADVAIVSTEIDNNITTHKNDANAHHAQTHDLDNHGSCTLAELSADITDATLIDTGDVRLSDTRDPNNHASEHTDGTDDIQNATNTVKGLATALQITKLEGIDTNADVTGSNPPQAHDLNSHNSCTVAELNADISDGNFAVTTRKLDDFGTPDDNTDLDSSTSEHGLLKKLNNDNTYYMNGTGAWSIPPGGAAGTVNIYLPAESAYLPADNPAELTEILGSTVYGGYSYLAFDDSVDEHAIWRIPVPDYDGGNIIFKFYWVSTETSGNVAWNIESIGVIDGEKILTAIVTDAVEITADTVTGTTLYLNITTHTTYNPASVTADDMMVIEITRDISRDNMAADARLMGIMIEYTRA